MRTECILPNNFSTRYNAKSPSFKGLWGESYYTETQNLYGGEMECDYYKLPYHPCADETPAEIKAQLAKQQKALAPFNEADALCYHGSYTSAVEGKRLPITKAELADIVKDCKEIIDGNLPPMQGLKKILKFK